MAAMTHDQPPTDIHEHRPNINPTLARAIHYCIEPNLAKRCKSMADFLQVIQNVRHVDGK
jgi:serine/threonine-protein kinase